MTEGERPGAGPASAGGDRASVPDRDLARFLRAEVRPLLGADAARLTRTVNDAIVHGDLAPLLALSSADRRMLLELLDRRSSRFRTLPECRSLVRLTELLLPPLAVDGRLAAPGVPAR